MKASKSKSMPTWILKSGRQGLTAIGEGVKKGWWSWLSSSRSSTRRWRRRQWEWLRRVGRGQSEMGEVFMARLWETTQRLPLIPARATACTRASSLRSIVPSLLETVGSTIPLETCPMLLWLSYYVGPAARTCNQMAQNCIPRVLTRCYAGNQTHPSTPYPPYPSNWQI